jgi:hypothetical protein
MFQFPYIFEQSQVLSTALDTYGCLVVASDCQAAPRSMTLPLCKAVLELPLDKAAQSDVMWFLSKTLEEGLGKAVMVSCKDLMSAFANYSYVSAKLSKTDPTSSSVFEAASSFFNSVLYKYKLYGACPLDPDIPYCQPITFHDWFVRLESRNSSRGEVSSQDSQLMQTNANLLMAANSKPQTAFLRTKSAREVVRELTEALLVDPHNCTETLGKLVATLIIEVSREGRQSWNLEVIHVIVWAPVRAWPLSASVVSIWEWLASSMPQLKVSLFQEISSLWHFLLYRGGIVVPGALHIPRVDRTAASPLFQSPQAVELSSVRSTGERLGGLKIEDVLTDTDFSSVKLDDLLTMQLNCLQFFSRQFHPCLVRNIQAALQISQIVKATLDCPAAASDSLLGLEVLMTLMSLACAVTKSRTEDLEAAVCRFSLEFFSESPKWHTIEHRARLVSLLSQLESMEMVSTR